MFSFDRHGAGLATSIFVSPQAMLNVCAELGWLPPAPSDFTARLRSLNESAAPIGAELKRLASYRLDDSQLTKIARFLGSASKAGTDVTPLKAYTLSVVSNATTDFICSAIVGTSPRFGLSVECCTGAFDQALHDSLNPQSSINACSPQAVLIAIDWRGLGLRPTIESAEHASKMVESARQYLNSVRTAIRQNSGAVCIVQNIATPPERLLGSLDRAVAGSLQGVIQTLNSVIAADIENSPDVLLDVAGLAEAVGLANWFSPAEWNLAKLPFSSDFLPLYADNVCRIIAALTGRSRRCLVLDLDNTLWGGVIGDDGLEGIQIAQGDATGEAYLEFQRYILALRDRGVVLAVSSKNQDDVARSPFRNHPEMILREEHVAVFQANWKDKPTNIAAIARELSLGLGSLVFVDDNPFERELVRNALPEVAVVELPADPAHYARTLSAAGYFEITKLTAEDFTRADAYSNNAKRAELQRSVSNLEEYLASLDMEIVFQQFDTVGRARIAQLINKSNQFNLTTRRYSEADIDAMMDDPDCFTLQIRLLDTFGDNGMISVVICRGVGADEWTIDTWLMSCRVLGRRVEQAVLSELMHHAAARGAKFLHGEFIPTDRNVLVKDHYRNLGFELITAHPDGATSWRISTRYHAPSTPPMRVRRIGFDSSAELAK